MSKEMNPVESAPVGVPTPAPQVMSAKSLAQLEAEVDRLVLDTSYNKYDIILLARRWAHELKNQEGETRSLQELVAVATKDLLSEKISHEKVRSLPKINRRGKLLPTATSAIAAEETAEAVSAEDSTEKSAKKESKKKGKSKS